MRRYTPLADQPLLHRFVHGITDVTSAVCVVSSTTLMSMNALQSAPRFVQILLPIIGAGAALLLGYSMGMRETEYLIRKAAREQGQGGFPALSGPAP
jgi:hypothetical protein